MVDGGKELKIIGELTKRLPTLDKPSVRLSQLVHGSYVDATVRVVAVRARDREDELGLRTCIVGAAEDSTFKVPFVCYKPHQAFFKDGVFKFEGAYVHEFDDHSLLLVLTERSRITYLPEEDPENYVWKPTVNSLNRPLGRCRVTLEGVVSKVYESSGLVKRCERCNRVMYQDRCPVCGEAKWFWSVRISSMLSDSTGSINMVFPQYLTCKLLGRPASEILCVAEVPSKFEVRGFAAEVFHVKPLEKLPLKESTVIEPALFKQCEKLIVPDYKRSKIYYPESGRVDSKHVLDVKDRLLDYSNEEDKLLCQKIFEKALDIEIRRKTGLPKIHGIYLTEQPTPLYWAEKAKLYLGFELYVSAESSSLKVEFYPAGLVRESVLDYVEWRRIRGASARSIERYLLKWRGNVILSPNGTIGKVEKVLYEDAGNFTVPDLGVSLPEFWSTAYDIKVKPDEKPLLVVKPYNVNLEFTYPPSCAFYDEQTVRIKSSVLSYVEYKKRVLRRFIPNLCRIVMNNLNFDRWKVEVSKGESPQIDVQRMILQEVRMKILGRRVKASGSVIQAGSQLYFVPKTIMQVT